MKRVREWGVVCIGIILVNILVFLGRVMERELGHVRFFLIYHIGMMAVSVLWCLIFRDGTMVGASMGIFVLLGIFMAWRIQGRQGRRLETVERWMPRGEWNYVLWYAVIGSFLSVASFAVHMTALLLGLGCGVCVRCGGEEEGK